MLLGISIMLLGGFFMIEGNTGFELFLLLGGFGVTLAGFINRNDK
jgi:hypothetical protein